jgi:alkanesulfonate monooxygenase SsuD/methylene tetrahydromethanopterin reductase-like flavin-dependent oxidoreductase (luciferase family)
VELFHRRAAEGSTRTPLADPVEAIAVLGAVPPPTPPSSLATGAWPLSFSGSAQRVHELINEMVTMTGADEVIIQDLIAHHDNRLHSYELIAEAFALSSGSGR